MKLILMPKNTTRAKRLDTAIVQGKQILSGHYRSHSERKTNRTFEPNIQRVKLYSETFGKKIALKVTTTALKTIEKYGGLDNYLLNYKKLDSNFAIWLRNKLREKKILNEKMEQRKQLVETYAQELAQQMVNNPDFELSKLESGEKSLLLAEQNLTEKDLEYLGIHKYLQQKDYEKETEIDSRTKWPNVLKYKARRPRYEQRTFRYEHEMSEKTLEIIEKNRDKLLRAAEKELSDPRESHVRKRN